MIETWRSLYPGAVPEEIEQLVREGVLRDVSSPDEGCPSFLFSGANRTTYRLWVNAPGNPTWFVIETEPESEDWFDEVLGTGEASAAVEAINELCARCQLPPAN